MALPPLAAIVNGSVADAVPVDTNYSTIHDYINSQMIHADGSVHMSSQLLLPADPVDSLAAATKQYVDNILPIGIIIPWAAPTAPVGPWLLCNGATVAVSTWPKLYDAIGFRFGGSGASFMLPNFTGRVPIGMDATRTAIDTVGKVGGTFTVPIPQHHHTFSHLHTMDHNHSSFTSGVNTSRHTHNINHDHPSATTSSAGAHDHDFSYVQDLPHPGGDGARIVGYVGGGLHASVSSVAAHTHTVNLPTTTGLVSGSDNTDHAHAIDVPPYTGSTGPPNIPGAVTSDTGTAGAEQLQPFVTITYIIRAG